MIHNLDCFELLKSLDSDSIDSLVTDPPAGISFMGKSWDDDKGGRDHWIMWLSDVMKECMRVMKPGAHGLVWAIPRTSHWTATALENAGFEVRDVVTHLFGSGFPKSLNIGKHLDEWQGWGTALKPASEHWILIRKPCSEKTVAKNVLKHGTGALNIDASRIETDWNTDPGLKKVGYKDGVNHKPKYNNESTFGGDQTGKAIGGYNLQGRFPANLVFSCTPHCTDEQHDIECAIRMLDEQSGHLHAPGSSGGGKTFGSKTDQLAVASKTQSFKDSGGASRFFYCAKVSSSERNAGLEGMPKTKLQDHANGTKRKLVAQAESPKNPNLPRENHHPTVKPIKLMSYLIKLITPPNGIVLDPFMGSGSTGVACKRLGFKFIGIEKEKEYFEIAEKRINHEVPSMFGRME